MVFDRETNCLLQYVSSSNDWKIFLIRTARELRKDRNPGKTILPMEVAPGGRMVWPVLEKRMISSQNRGGWEFLSRPVNAQRRVPSNGQGISFSSDFIRRSR
jgi:hypothetical protein